MTTLRRPQRKRCPNFTLTRENLMEHVKVNPGTGCWEWIHATTKGYGRKRVNGKPVTVTRIVYEMFKGPLQPGQGVLHSCDNPPCCNPAHLFAGDQLVNNQDKASKGRAPIGEGHKNSRFTRADVIEMRRLRRQHFTLYQIAAQFGTNHRRVGKIVSGQAWAHVPMDAKN